MPQNIVLNLVTQSAVSPVHLQGYSLQQLFFNLVEVVDPLLGHALRRDQSNDFYSLSALQVKPAKDGAASYRREYGFSQLPAKKLQLIGHTNHMSADHTNRLSEVSGLYQKETDRQAIYRHVDDFALQYAHMHMLPAQTECWWCISFLDDALFDHLAFLWRQLENEVFQLGSGSISLCSTTTDAKAIAWADSCSYRDLYEQASSYERDIQIQLVTPTAFSGKDDGYTPLPTAEAIFQPLRKCWNRYSKLAFTPQLINHIIPTEFSIQTQPVQYIQHHSVQAFTGCIGTIRFRITGESDPLDIKRINAIANFAQYCNIGQGARFGMGFVRRLMSPTTLLEQPVN